MHLYTLQPYRDIPSILFCRLINVDILLLFLTIFIRYKAEIKDNRHIVNATYTCTFSSSFIDRINFNFIDIWFHLISSELWPSGYNGGLVIWVPCGVGGSNPTVDKSFCNVHLFRVPRSWTGSVWKEWALALTFDLCKRQDENTYTNIVSDSQSCSLEIKLDSLILWTALFLHLLNITFQLCRHIAQNTCLFMLFLHVYRYRMDLTATILIL